MSNSTGKGKSATTEVVDTQAIETEVQVVPTAKMYELDTELFSEEYFAPLEESLPYAISDSRGFLTIPETEIEKSLWLDPPKEFVTESIKGGEPFSSFRMSDIRISLLQKSAPYWYYSNSPENRASKLVGPICWYNSPEGQVLKEELKTAPLPPSNIRPYVYAVKLQIMLLDGDNIPLHEVPLSCNFRGSACWQILDELRKFYSSAEKTLSKVGNFRRTSFNEQVRALLIPGIKFGSEWVGSGVKSEAIRIKEITKPTIENMNEWYLGFKHTTATRNLIWQTQLDYKDCGANRLPTPIALPSAPVPSALAATANAPQLNPGSEVDPQAADIF
ncbi:MAG: DUF5895 domain-containing protein [Cyanobacteriota bacterium]|nr:DUF5895 domain-containing protein [Cyanobacteriota bacterium]